MSEKMDEMKPIIEVIMGQIRSQYEDGIYNAVQDYGISVDKERLLQALTDARRFWQEGYDACLEWKPRWISVEERLPEVGVTVLTLDKYGHIHDRYTYRHQYGTALFTAENLVTSKDITHWMPLPEPPEVEG